MEKFVVLTGEFWGDLLYISRLLQCPVETIPPTQTGDYGERLPSKLCFRVRVVGYGRNLCIYLRKLTYLRLTWSLPEVKNKNKQSEWERAR